MRYGTNSRGYTILEVMIFLAISGFMFVVASSFINGKQTKAEFSQSMTAINAEVQGTINAVANGYYPSTNTHKCKADAIGYPYFPAADATTEQGNNKGCVFMGKFIQFGDHVNITDGINATYNVYSIVGRQFVGSEASAKLPSTFTESKPTIGDGLTEQKKLLYGLNITKITKTSSGGVTTPLVGIGFFNSLSSYATGGGDALESGPQSVNVVTLPETGTYMRNQVLSSPGGMALQINGINDSDIEPRPNILICFTGNADQFGTLTIGSANGSRLATKVQISSTLAPGC